MRAPRRVQEGLKKGPRGLYNQRLGLYTSLGPSGIPPWTFSEPSWGFGAVQDSPQRAAKSTPRGVPSPAWSQRGTAGSPR
eukprot:9252192-Pyramimonas_sp.AAC.1